MHRHRNKSNSYKSSDLYPCQRQMPCKNGATCINNGLGDYICQCPDGYAGEQCRTDINECFPNPCQNGGTCTVCSYVVFLYKPAWHSFHYFSFIPPLFLKSFPLSLGFSSPHPLPPFSLIPSSFSLYLSVSHLVTPLPPFSFSNPSLCFSSLHPPHPFLSCSPLSLLCIGYGGSLHMFMYGWI